MGIRSIFRSKRMRTGLEERFEWPAVEELLDFENRLLSRELRIWSRSFRSNFWAIKAAALSLGQRMMGICPLRKVSKIHQFLGGKICT